MPSRGNTIHRAARDRACAPRGFTTSRPADEDAGARVCDPRAACALFSDVRRRRRRRATKLRNRRLQHTLDAVPYSGAITTLMQYHTDPPATAARTAAATAATRSSAHATTTGTAATAASALPVTAAADPLARALRLPDAALPTLALGAARGVALAAAPPLRVAVGPCASPPVASVAAGRGESASTAPPRVNAKTSASAGASHAYNTHSSALPLSAASAAAMPVPQSPVAAPAAPPAGALCESSLSAPATVASPSPPRRRVELTSTTRRAPQRQALSLRPMVPSSCSWRPPAWRA